MRLTNSQRANGRAPVGRRFPWLGLWAWLGLGAWLACGSAVAFGQAPFVADPYQGAPNDAPDVLPFDQFSGRNGDALGAVWRGGFLTGPALGREDSIAPIEMMPYFFLEDTMVFGDLRGFRSVEDHYGFNTGFGVRRYLRKTDRIIGANFYYDYDNTTVGRLFRQVGGGLEFLGPTWDMRLNAYFPVTQNTQEIDLSDPFNIRFNANNILFDQIRTFGVHQKGVDHELAVPLPSRHLERHNVKAVAGWYHFQQTGSENTWGWKGRLEGDLTANVHLGLEVTNDNTFDTNVVLSVAMSYGGFREPEGQRRTTFSRMTDHIHRQYTAVVAKVPVLEAGVVALKPDGTPYIVEHVAGQDPYDRGNIPALRALAPQYDPAAVLGTFENPFLTVADAQANPDALSDITFVWANSVYDNTPLTTESGNRLLGEADNAPHTFVLLGQDQLLPRAIGNTTDGVAQDKPLYINTVGDGVILTPGLNLPNGGIQRTEFSGFSIGDEDTLGSGPTGHGIIARAVDDVGNVTMRFNEINFATLDGIRLEDVGRIEMVGNRIFNAGADGLHIIDGAPQITFTRDNATSDNFRLEIQADGQIVPTGYAVHLESLDPGSNVDMVRFSPARIDYVGAGGVLIDDGVVDPDPPEATGGTALFGEITVTNSPVDAINILGSNALDSGNYSFRSPVLIDNNVTDSINIEGQEGTISFLQDVEITDRGARGIDLRGNAGNVLFSSPVEIVASGTGGVITTLPGIEYQQSSGGVAFSGDLTIDDGNGDGILIGILNPTDSTLATNNTGTFTVSGQTNLSNLNGISLRILEDDSRVTFGGTVDISNRGNVGILIDRQRQPVRFNDETTVDNELLTQATAVVLNGSGTTNLPPNTPPEFETFGEISFEVLNIENGRPTILAAAFPDQTGVSGLLATNLRSPVAIGELNITGDDGTGTLATGLFVRDVGDPYTNLGEGGLVVSTGVIDITDGTAIDVEDSKINLTLESVSSSDALGNGIRMVNNVGTNSQGQGGGVTLNVTGVPGGDGGTISDASLDGIFLENTGNIVLNLMEVVDSDLNGIVVLNTPGVRTIGTDLINFGRFGDAIYTNTLLLRDVDVQDSGLSGLFTFNIPNVGLQRGEYEGNGDDTSLSEISLIYNIALDDPDDPTDAEGLYEIRIEDVTVTESGVEADAIEIGANNPVGTPRINLVMTGLDPDLAVVTLEDAPLDDVTPTGLLIQLDGEVNADIQGYTFIVERPSSVGVNIDQQSEDDPANVIFSNNVVVVGSTTEIADNSTALLADIQGVSSFTVNDNLILLHFLSSGTVGIDLSFESAVDLSIGGVNDNTYVNQIYDDDNPDSDTPYGNLILADSDLATAIQLDFNDDSQVEIENNFIDNEDTLLYFSLGVRGIVIDGNEGVELFGNLDNFIFLDIPNVNTFPTGVDDRVAGSGDPWFIYRGAGPIGSILVNGVPQP